MNLSEKLTDINKTNSVAGKMLHKQKHQNDPGQNFKCQALGIHVNKQIDGSRCRPASKGFDCHIKTDTGQRGVNNKCDLPFLFVCLHPFTWTLLYLPGKTGG